MTPILDGIQLIADAPGPDHPLIKRFTGVGDYEKVSPYDKTVGGDLTYEV
jgi:hypothetical protein